MLKKFKITKKLLNGVDLRINKKSNWMTNGHWCILKDSSVVIDVCPSDFELTDAQVDYVLKLSTEARNNVVPTKFLMEVDGLVSRIHLVIDPDFPEVYKNVILIDEKYKSILELGECKISDNKRDPVYIFFNNEVVAMCMGVCSDGLANELNAITDNLHVYNNK